jgi:hypothetical protein
VTARIARRDLEGKAAALEVGGWNIQTEYRCSDLKLLPTTVKAGEAFAVTARITDTFLDGSRVALAVDGKRAGAKWAWARGGKADAVSFQVSLPNHGAHQLTLGRQTIKVNAE